MKIFEEWLEEEQKFSKGQSNEFDYDIMDRLEKSADIKIILDGVFNHTGDDSRYFNRRETYGEGGAYRAENSPYSKWYHFRKFPEDYECWWGIKILPRLNHQNEECRRYFTGEDGIIARWTERGVDGWRLDVADELSNEFLDELRHVVKKNTQNEGLIIGEVWENAVTKTAYGKRRKYFWGGQLDSVMNYPFAEAIISFIRSGRVEGFSDKIMTITENYPKCCVDVLMNHIGTHDTMRAITQLAGESCEYRDRSWQSGRMLSEKQYEYGVKLLKLAAAIQFTLPGVPSVYYGDEAGMQGYKDPFNRYCFPWGRENTELQEYYKALGKMRRECDCLKQGEYVTVSEMLSCLAYVRYSDKDKILVIVNRNEHEIDYYLPSDWHNTRAVFGTGAMGDRAHLDALSVIILKKEN